jgi:DNA primase
MSPRKDTMTLVDMAKQRGLNPKWKASTQGGEYASACPTCGGTDRFIIQPSRVMKQCVGYYFCRQCAISGDTIQFGRDFMGLSYQDAKMQANANSPGQSLLPYSTHVKMVSHDNVQTLNLPSNTWMAKANLVMQEANKNIMQQEDVLHALNQRGLSQDAIIKYQIGWLSEDAVYNGADWGLEREEIWLSAGIVIPTIDGANVIRLKIRRKNWKENDELPKYIAISGSMGGLNIIGAKKNAIMIIVESELDAYALHNAIGDFACIVAVGGCVKNIDNVTDALAKKKVLLICPDNDNAGKKMLEKWQKLYPHAKAYPTPYGKDIGEAVSLGLDVREFFSSAINTVNVAQQGNANVKSVQASPSVPVICATTPPTVVPQQIALPVMTVAIADEVPQQGDGGDRSNALSISTASPLNPIEKANSKNEYTESHSDVSNAEWPPQDRELITWARHYLQAIPEYAKLLSDKHLSKEIEQGPTSEHAQSGALQKELRWIRRLVSGEIL